MIGFDPLANPSLWLKKKPIVEWKKSDIGKFSPNPQYASVVNEPKASFTAPAPKPIQQSQQIWFNPLNALEQPQSSVVPSTPKPVEKKQLTGIDQAADSTINLLLADLKTDISEKALTVDEMYNLYPEIPQDIAWMIYADINSWYMMDEIKQAYPELQSIQPSANIPVQWVLNSGTWQPLWGKFSQVQQKWWEWNDNLLPMMQTTNNASTVWWTVAEFGKNILKSWYNLLAWGTNAVINPIDTVKTIWTLWVWAIQNAYELVTWDEQSGESAQMASAVWQYFMDRYWSLEKFQQASYEDPVWVFSDLATVVSWWATIAGKTAQVWWVVAKTAWATKTANTLNKIAKWAKTVENIADMVDPWNIPFRVAGKWLEKWIEVAKPIVQKGIQQGTKIVEWANKVIDNASEFTTRDFPIARTEKDLWLTPKERTSIEKTWIKAWEFMLKEKIADLSKENQISKLWEIADNNYNNITKDVQKIPLTERITDPSINKALWIMIDEMESSPIIAKEYWDYINKLKELYLQKDFDAPMTNAIKRDFDKIIWNKIYNAQWRVTNLENEVIAWYRESMYKSLEDTANKYWIDIRQKNTDMRNAINIRNWLIRRLSQETKNNTFSLQDIWIWAILSSWEPITWIWVVIAKKWIERAIPTVSQKLYNINKEKPKVQDIKKWVPIKKSSKFSISNQKRTTAIVPLKEWQLISGVPQKKTPDFIATSKWLVPVQKKWVTEINDNAPRKDFATKQISATDKKKWLQAKQDKETTSILSSKSFDKDKMTKIKAYWYQDEAPRKWDYTDKWRIVETTHWWWTYPKWKVKVEWDNYWKMADELEIYRKKGLEPKETPKLQEKKTEPVKEVVKQDTPKIWDKAWQKPRTEAKPLPETNKATSRDELMKQEEINQKTSKWPEKRIVTNTGKRKYILDDIQKEYWFNVDDLSIEDNNKLITALHANTKVDTQIKIVEEIAEKYGKKFKKQTEELGKWLSQAEIQKTVNKYFKPDEVSIVFREKITTPDGWNAFGAYLNKMIEFAENPMKGTVEHEVVHAYIDLFKTNQQKFDILEHVLENNKLEVWGVKKKYWLADDLTAAEEFLADWFIKYTQWKATFTGKIKTYFQNLLDDVKKVFGKGDKVRQLYRDIEGMKRPKWLEPKNTTKKFMQQDTTDLYTEARKYKSAEEFKKSMQELYHGTQNYKIESIEKEWFRAWRNDSKWVDLYWEWVYLTDNSKIAKWHSWGWQSKDANWKVIVWDGTVMNVYIPKSLKLYDLSKVESWLPVHWKALSDYLKEKWYDWSFLHTKQSWTTYTIYDPKNLIIESQLRKIREEANKWLPEKKFMKDTSDDVKELVALHNLNEDKLMKVVGLWWMPMPSIAVTKKWIPFENFGDITLVGKKSLVDPQATSWNKLYTSDVYTARVPQASLVTKPRKYIDNELQNAVKWLEDYDIKDYDLLNELEWNWEYALLVKFAKDNNIKFNKTMEEIKPRWNFVWRRWVEWKDWWDLAKALGISWYDEFIKLDSSQKEILYKNMLQTYVKKYDKTWIWAEIAKDIWKSDIIWLEDYLRESRVKSQRINKYAIKNELREIIDKQELSNKYKKFVNELENKFFDKKLFKWHTYIWNKSYEDYSMDNIMKQMKKKWVWGESWIFAGNFSQMIAKRASKVKNLWLVKKMQFWSDEILTKKYESLWEEYSSLVVNLADKNKKWFFDYVTNLSDWYSKNIDSWKAKMDDWGTPVTIQELEKIDQIIEEWSRLPKSYIEWKPERAVKMQEFEYVLAPEKDIANIKEILKDTPLKDKIVWYEPKEWSRTAKLQELQDKYGNVFFSLAWVLFPISYLLAWNDDKQSKWLKPKSK